jgi:hypothetical protein
MAFQVTIRERVSIRKPQRDGVDAEALTWAITVVMLASWIGIHI